MRVHEFLKDCFDLPDETAKLAWEFLLGFELSAEEQSAHRIKHVKLFLEYGLSREIGVYSLCPPTRVCLDPRCAQPLHSDSGVLRDRELGEPRSHPITCNNPNLLPLDAMPEFIHTSEHFYITADLCELFSNMMMTVSKTPGLRRLVTITWRLIYWGNDENRKRDPIIPEREEVVEGASGTVDALARLIMEYINFLTPFITTTNGEILNDILHAAPTLYAALIPPTHPCHNPVTVLYHKTEGWIYS
ncbi:hypothetical protein B0H13DRAFT_2356955 [Mycena leptocephala]|nr:hypothetical protein B0H13DRAFT_2356955 [Mycena leptocephala]